MTLALQATDGRFSSLSQQMGKWVEQVLGPGYHNYCPGEAWSPAINLCEDQTGYLLVVDLAGLADEEVNREDFLGIDRGILVISGSRRTPGLDELAGSARLHHMEIDHGKFCRSIPLPQDIDATRIEATYKKGFLWVRMPKAS